MCLVRVRVSVEIDDHGERAGVPRLAHRSVVSFSREFLCFAVPRRARDVGANDVCMSRRSVDVVRLFRGRRRDEGAVRCITNGLRLVREIGLDVRGGSVRGRVYTLKRGGFNNGVASKEARSEMSIISPQGDDRAAARPPRGKGAVSFYLIIKSAVRRY